MAYLIGVDLGTSGTKTALFDERGRRIASRTVEYPLSQPKNGLAEQEPEHWWKAACETIRAVIAESGVDAGAIKGVGLSGQMHGLVMLDAAGLMVTMYFMGALVMRLLSPFVYRKLGVKRYYQLTLLVSAALYLVFLLLPMPDWCRKAMVFALGLLQGATVPTLVILCCDAFPERTASASSVVVTGVSLASMVSPVVLGKLLTIDPQTAMLSITVCTVIAALVLPKSRKA